MEALLHSLSLILLSPGLFLSISPVLLVIWLERPKTHSLNLVNLILQRAFLYTSGLFEILRILFKFQYYITALLFFSLHIF